MIYRNDNITITDDYVKGTIKDLKEYFRTEINNIVNNGDYDTDEVIYYVGITLEILKELEYKEHEDNIVVIKCGDIERFYIEEQEEER